MKSKPFEIRRFRMEIFATIILVGAVSGVFAQFFYPGVTPNPNSKLKNMNVLLLNLPPYSGSHLAEQTAATAMWDSINKYVGFHSYKKDTALTFLDTTNLKNYNIIIVNYLWQIGLTITDAAQRAAIKQFWMNGGSFIAYHTSLDVKASWTWYSDSVCGMDFLQYNEDQNGTMSQDPGAVGLPVVQGLPSPVTTEDEWYPMTPNPRSDPWTTILYTLNESTLPNGPGANPMAPDHPVAWVRDFPTGGHAYCTIIDHNVAVINSQLFRTMMLRAAEYVAGYSTTPIFNGISLKPSGTLYVNLSQNNLKVESNKPYRLQIWSTRGELLYTNRGDVGTRLYQVGAFHKSGIYLAKVESGDGIFTQKILIQ